MAKRRPVSFVRLGAVIILLAAGCGRPPTHPVSKARPAHHRPMPQASAVASAFATGGVYAEDSMYACLLDAYYQGLSLQQALSVCQMNLLEDADKGWGNDPWAAGGFTKPDSVAYDPAKVSAACSAGDPGRAQGGGAGKGQPLQEGCIGKCTWTGPNTFEGSKFTFGGKGVEGGFGENENGEIGIVKYQGLSEAEARAQKQQALDEEEAATKELVELISKQTKELEAQGKKAEDWEKDPAMKAAREAATKKANAASKKADADPNAAVVGGITRPRPESSECEMALQEAREFLRECNRVGWKSVECRTLQAKMNHCPEPVYIYVDPDAGYSCGLTIDPASVTAAWKEQCEALRRPVPGGPNPCDPPDVDRDGRIVKPRRADGSWDPCSDPAAHIDPESQECVEVFSAKPFGEVNLRQLLVFGLDKFGGPTFVIPVDSAGDDPRPRPGDPPTP